MAIATFHSTRGKNSALIMVKANPLEFGATPVYVPRDGVTHFSGLAIDKIEKGHSFEIPDGFTLVDITTVDEETGEISTATTKDGVVLKKLQY